MKALVCNGPRDLSYQDTKTPIGGPSDVLVQITAASICGSDLMVLNGNHPYKGYPSILGHEFIGLVIKSKDASFSKGDRVSGLSYGSCGTCIYCRDGHSNHCVNKTTYSTPGHGGCFSEYMLLNYSSVEKLPQLPDTDTFVLAEPLSVIFRALSNQEFRISSESTLIIGAGPIGLLCALYLRIKNPKMEIFLQEIDSNRINFATKLGFRCAHISNENFKKNYHNLIIAGGRELNLQPIISQLSTRGKIINISYHDQPISLDFNTLVRKEITIRNSGSSGFYV